MTVIELESFYRAAERLNMSQPALSRRIQKLEELVGHKLLERTTRYIRPTATGLELVPLVRRMLEEFDASLFNLGEKAPRRGGLITIACLPTAAFYFLPHIISQFGQTYPDIRFRILDLTATEGLHAVAQGAAEFGINIIGTSENDLIFERLIEDKFVLAMPKNHPLAQKQIVKWDMLAPYPLITVHRSSANRTLLDAALARANIKLNWRYEVAHLSTSLGFVEAGLGVSVLPQMATPQGEHPFLVTRPLGLPHISRVIGVVKRRGVVLSPAAGYFLDMLLERFPKSGSHFSENALYENSARCS